MRRRKRLNALTAVFAATLTAVMLAGCEGKPDGALGDPKNLPDWGGLWESVDGLSFTATAGPDNPPPLTPEYAPKFAEISTKAEKGEVVNDPTANCLPPGMPRIISAPFPTEFIFSPGRVTIVHEYFSQVRRVRTDGSGHPADLEPSYNGDSIGHWEGDTLVIETVGLRDDTLIEVTGLQHSDQLRVVERLRLSGPDDLLNEITITDPKIFSRPWTIKWRFKRHRDWTFADFVCAENNRNPHVNGDTQFIR